MPPQFCGSKPATKAKSLLALSLLKMLFALEDRLAEYRQRIEELFAPIPITSFLALYRARAPSWLPAC